jgi:Ase1/PRC1/MAP65 family protein
VKVPLVAILEEQKLRRAQRDEEKRRSRVKINAMSYNLFDKSTTRKEPYLLYLLTLNLLQGQKKLQSLLLKEKELIFGSKPTPRKSSSFSRRTSSHHPNGNGTGFMTPVPRRVSAGSATPELLSPRSYSGRYNNYFKDNMRLKPAPLNFSTASKEDSMSSFASISGSEPDSPLYLH